MENLKLALNIIKENLIYAALILLALVLFIFVVLPEGGKGINAFKTMKEKEVSYNQLKEQYDALKMQQDAQNRAKKIVKDGKVIFDAPGMQFSPDASFAPLFELMLTLAQQSGIRIRAIDYNYTPADDIVFNAKLQGYNACELSMIAVGSYSEFQNFFKSVMKEQYLSSLAEVEMTPWEKDKKVLITKLKLRLYTRTMD